VVAALFEDLVVAEVPDRRLGGPQGVPGVEVVDTDLGTQFLGSHVRVAVLQDPVDLAGLGEIALARVVGPVVLQVPGATTDAGLEVDAVRLQDGVAVFDVQVEDGGADGTTTHVDGGTTLVVVDVLGAGGAGGRGGGQAECQERGNACGKAHAPGGTGEGDVSQIVSRCRLGVTGRRCPPLARGGEESGRTVRWSRLGGPWKKTARYVHPEVNHVGVWGCASMRGRGPPGGLAVVRKPVTHAVGCQRVLDTSDPCVWFQAGSQK